MSLYGHLTQSTIIPKKSKEILIGNSGLSGLQAILKQERTKIPVKPLQPLGYISKKRKTPQPMTVAPTTGARPSELVSESKLIEHNLRIKTKMYEQQQKSLVQTKDSLIDFGGKYLQNNSEYDSLKQQFYAQKMKQIQQKREANSKYFQLGNNKDRERFAWEKRKLEELTDMRRQLTGERVVQSYDRVLSAEKWQALQEVRKEERREKEKVVEGRRRREHEFQDRIRKLRNLGVITGPQSTPEGERGND